MRHVPYEPSPLHGSIVGDLQVQGVGQTQALRPDGTRDWLIPIRQSEQLQSINPHKITLIRIEGGGHNNLPTFPEYHNFLRDILKY